MRGLLLLFFLLILIIVPLESHAQTLCTPLGSSVYCSGPNTQATITPLSKTQGVISTPEKVVPYTILPAPQPGIQPLRPLEPLPTLREPVPSSETLPLPFSSGGSVILGE